MPSVFLILNIGVSFGILDIINSVKKDGMLNGLGAVLVPIGLVCIIFYLLSAYTNPGLLIGNETV